MYEVTDLYHFEENYIHKSDADNQVLLGSGFRDIFSSMIYNLDIITIHIDPHNVLRCCILFMHGEFTFIVLDKTKSCHYAEVGMIKALRSLFENDLTIEITGNLLLMAKSESDKILKLLEDVKK